MNVDDLKAVLRHHEGVRPVPYYDTVGRVTVGVGRNLNNKPLRPDEIEYLLNNDVRDVLADCAKLSWFTHLNDARQLVVADMIFNLGLVGFLQFTKFIEAMNIEDFEEAAHQMMASKWARQVGQRAKELSAWMRSGTVPE